MRPAIAALAIVALCAGTASAQVQDKRSAALSVKQSTEYGAYLADAEGRAVYLLEADDKGRSTCHGRCAAVWPPVVTEPGKPVPAETGVQSGLIGKMKRADGSIHVTYNGHPLYYYVKDQGRAVTGHQVQDAWGEWYLVTPRGGKLEQG